MKRRDYHYTPSAETLRRYTRLRRQYEADPQLTLREQARREGLTYNGLCTMYDWLRQNGVEMRDCRPGKPQPPPPVEPAPATPQRDPLLDDIAKDLADLQALLEASR